MKIDLDNYYTSFLPLGFFLFTFRVGNSQEKKRTKVDFPTYFFLLSRCRLVCLRFIINIIIELRGELFLSTQKSL